MTDNDINGRRRSLLKGIGAAAGAGIVGSTGVKADTNESEVSTSRVLAALSRRESLVALQTAGVNSLQSFRFEEARLENIRLTNDAGTEINNAEWVVVPFGQDGIFAYNEEESVAEIETESGSLVRAKPDDDGLFVEHLELGDTITTEALQTLADNPDFEEALQNADVHSTNTEEASAHFDRESGTTRVFVPMTRTDGKEGQLLVELNEYDELEAVYGFTGSDEFGIMGIECWASCITVGRFCSTICKPCLSVPSKPTCAPCAACIGGSATICAVGCGISQFW